MKRLKILLVEDNPDDVLITQRTLKKGNLKDELFVVKDGEEALGFLNKRGAHQDAPKPDLIFLDLNLPKVSGLEVLEKIKQSEQLAHPCNCADHVEAGGRPYSRLRFRRQQLHPKTSHFQRIHSRH